MFEREAFVDDLYNTYSVLECFDIIEFESLNTFLRLIQHDMLKLQWSKELRVPLNRSENIDLLLQIVDGSALLEHGNINFLIEPPLLMDMLSRTNDKIWSSKFALTLTSYTDTSVVSLTEIVPHVKTWIQSNPIYIKERITFQTVRQAVQRMVEAFKYTGIRFYDLSFDYESFNDMMVREFDEVEFWLNHLTTWMRQEHPHRICLKTYNMLVRPCYITEDLQIKINKDAPVLFNMSANLDKTGTDIPAKELNILRQYIDLKQHHLQLPDPFNHYLIDYSQNSMLRTSVNEVPWITTLLVSRVAV